MLSRCGFFFWILRSIWPLVNHFRGNGVFTIFRHWFCQKPQREMKLPQSHHPGVELSPDHESGIGFSKLGPVQEISLFKCLFFKHIWLTITQERNMLWTRECAHSIRAAILHKICSTHIRGPPPLTLVQEKGFPKPQSTYNYHFCAAFWWYSLYSRRPTYYYSMAFEIAGY